MFQDSPMTAAEDAAAAAWNEYADAAQNLRTAWETPGITSSNRRALHERALDAHERFRNAYEALSAPTPESMEKERNWLACEGVLLVSMLAAFVGLFLPDLEAEFWPLAFTFATVGCLGAWSYAYLARLGSHLGDRL